MANSGTVRLPNFSLPNSMAPLGRALDKADDFGRAYAPHAKMMGRIGLRVATRMVPIVLAAQFADRYWLEHIKQPKPFGPPAVDNRNGTWTATQTCGSADAAGNGSWPDCVNDRVVGYGSQIGPGPFKGQSMWLFNHPPYKYHINGSPIAKPGVYYEAVFSGWPDARNAISVHIPMADTRSVPTMFGLYPAMSPILAPRGDNRHIPFVVLPHLRQNPNLPAAVQLSQSYAAESRRDYAIPVIPTVEGRDAAPPGSAAAAVETFPNVSIPAKGIVVGGVTLPGTASSNPGTVAQPGTAIVFPAVPTAPAFPIAKAHVLAPPGPATKEKKFILTPGANNAVVKIFNSLTETEDLIDALYWAIEPEYTGNIVYNKRIMAYDRLKGRKVWFKKNGKWQSRWVYDHSMAAKADWVYRHLQDMNLRKALANYIKNEIGDRAYGVVGKVGGKAARATGAARSPTISRRTGYSPALPLDPIYDTVDGILGV